MTRYVGFLDGVDGAWGVVLPDFPGVHGGGATADDAVHDATLALRAIAAQMVGDGEVLPEPRTFEAIDRERDAASEPRAALVYIRLIRDRASPVRANISLDAGLLDAIDQEARRRGLTRSAFISSMALEELSRGS